VLTPDRPKIYHITHIDNLEQIVDGMLWSDAERIRRTLNCQIVGMNEIKRRRLEELEVTCHPGTRVGECVPFYFCPRSVMLYLLYQGNHPQLAYRGGQRPILHLEADLHGSVQWADTNRKRWAFTNGNAGTRYTPFFNDLMRLNDLNWESIAATDWRDPIVKERKQAEFLVQQCFSWQLIERIGVIDNETSERVSAILADADHKPAIVVARNWYY
jgi:hypothetical protein